MKQITLFRHKATNILESSQSVEMNSSYFDQVHQNPMPIYVRNYLN